MTPEVSQGKAAGEITQVAASPTGSHLAAGHADGTIRIWNLESGDCEVCILVACVHNVIKKTAHAMVSVLAMKTFDACALRLYLPMHQDAAASELHMISSYTVIVLAFGRLGQCEGDLNTIAFPRR